MRSAAARVVVLMLSMSCAVMAQSPTASLTGYVRDSSQGAIADAEVVVINTGTNIRHEVRTDHAGTYNLMNLPPGSYRIEVAKPGFKSVVKSDVVLHLQDVVAINFEMAVGSISQVMTVEGGAPLLESSSSTLSQVIENRSITNLPLNQRNPYALVFLAPGVIGSVRAEFNQANISINGGRPGANEILADGIPSSPPLVNPIQGFTVYPSVDSIQESRVMTNAYSAEFGRSSGGIINLVFKSGTNQFHGSAYEFLRNSRLDANAFFANQRGIPLANFKRNQFGASAGGPVRLPRLYNGRDHTFFFMSYEGLRERSQNNLTNTVPTQLQRDGDFSKTVNATGLPLTIYDPATTTRTGAGFTRQAFPGNVIPAARIDPVARNVLKYYPLPTRPPDNPAGVNNLTLPGSAPTDSYSFDIKGDENVNDRNRFFVRVSHRNYDLGVVNRFPADIAVAQGDSYQPQISNNAAFDYTFTARPTFLVDFRYGFGRTLLNFSPRSAGFNPSSLGLPSSISGNADGLYFPTFNPSGYLALGNNSYFRHNAFETHNWSLNNSKVLTGHVLRFGFEARLVRVNNSEITDAVGNFSFDKSLTQGPNPNQATNTAGDAMASFLLGTGTGVMTKCYKCVSTQSTYWAWYVADDWRLTGKLTLNLGLRYELEIPRHERYNRMNVFDPGAPSPLAGPAGLPDLRGGLVFAGVNGVPAQQFEADRNNLAPRFGFAYQALPYTVIRGGAGIFYAPSLRAAGGTVGNYGYRSDTQFISAPDGVTPVNYLHNPFPGGFTPVAGTSQGLLTAAGSPISSSLRGDNVVPYSENWNLNLQQQLRGRVLIQAGYVGSHGLHLNRTGDGTADLNQLTADQLALGTALQTQVRNPFSGLISSGPLAAPTLPRGYLLRAYPQFTSVSPLFWTGASSIYHSLQAGVEKRFDHGLSLLISYTKGKLIDDYSTISAVGRNTNLQNIKDRKNERAVSSNDISQRFVGSAVYVLPFGRGRRFGLKMNRVTEAFVGGWQVNGIVTVQSGDPLAVTMANNLGALAGNNVLRPNSTGRTAKLDGSDKDRLLRYFDVSQFTPPAPFTYGNAGRTLPDVRGPGLRNIDFSLFKNYAVAERISLQFRAEAFNLTNTASFSDPNQNFSNSGFGQINSTSNAARQVQFGLKLLW